MEYVFSEDVYEIIYQAAVRHHMVHSKHAHAAHGFIASQMEK